MPQAISDLALIETAIWPPVEAMSSDPVVSKLSLILYAVLPIELAVAMEQAIVELTNILVSILKGNLSGAIQTFSINLRILRGHRDLSLPFLVENLGQLYG